jgi:hypothetical protein
VTPPALNQRVIEHRHVIVLARDRNDPFPDARMLDPIVVHLRPEVVLIDFGKGIPGAVHAAAAVASADDCDELT